MIEQYLHIVHPCTCHSASLVCWAILCSHSALLWLHPGDNLKTVLEHEWINSHPLKQGEIQWLPQGNKTQPWFKLQAAVWHFSNLLVIVKSKSSLEVINNILLYSTSHSGDANKWRSCSCRNEPVHKLYNWARSQICLSLLDIALNFLMSAIRCDSRRTCHPKLNKTAKNEQQASHYCHIIAQLIPKGWNWIAEKKQLCCRNSKCPDEMCCTNVSHHFFFQTKWNGQLEDQRVKTTNTDQNSKGMLPFQEIIGFHPLLSKELLKSI